MLPEVIWSMPSLGTFNLHASLLPQYRGAAPINWALINGEKETGVTTFFLKHEIDTGNIIFQEREPILEHDDAGSLYERLKNKGGQIVLRTMRAIQAGNCPTQPQPTLVDPKLAPKIFKETCEINWNQSSESIRNFVRGLSPYPAAWTMMEGKQYKVFRIQKTEDRSQKSEDRRQKSAPGQLETDNKTYLCIRTADGWISVDELQPEGKKRMLIRDFLLGNKLKTLS